MKISLRLFPLVLVTTSLSQILLAGINANKSRLPPVVVQYSPITNFVYQLNCVSDLITCSRKNYKMLWEKEFIKSPEDRDAIDSWQKLMKLYRTPVALNENPPSSTKIYLFTRLLFASFQAKEPQDYMQRLELLTRNKDLMELDRIVSRFYPRYFSWWQKNAKNIGEKYRDQLTAELQDADALTLLGQFYDFYEAKTQSHLTIQFSIVYRPNLTEEANSASQIDNYAIMEFREDSNPRQSLDVAIHELCHFFYTSVEDAKKIELKDRFLNYKSPGALVAYNLLNETLATTFGNGLMAQSLEKDAKKWQAYLDRQNSFYNDFHIDAAAKATMPWLKQYIANGATIYEPKFVETYVGKLQEALGDQLLATKPMLAQAFVFLDQELSEEIMEKYFETFEPNSTFSFHDPIGDDEWRAEFKNHEKKTALFVVKKSSLASLAKYLGIEDVALLTSKPEQPSIYAELRRGLSYLIILSANDNAQAQLLIKELKKIRPLKEKELWAF